MANKNITGALPLNFRKKFEGGMAIVNTVDTSSVNSVYAKAQAGTAISRNLWEAVRLLHGKEVGGRKGFVAYQGNKFNVVAELQSTDETHSVLLTNDGGKFTVKVDVCHKDGTHEDYLMRGHSALKGIGRSGSVILLALIPFTINNNECKDAYDALMKYVSMDETSSWTEAEAADFAKKLALFGDNIYRRMGFNHNPVMLPTPDLELPAPDDFVQQYTNMFNTNIKVADVIVGSPVMFTVEEDAPAAAPEESSATATAEKQPAALPVFDLGEFGSPAYSEEDKAEVERNRAEVLAITGGVVPEWVMDLSYRVVDSFRYRLPQTVEYLVGDAGCGKSTGAKAMAALLGLKYTFLTCQPDTDFISLFGSIIPETGSNKIDADEIRRELGLPTDEEVTTDPSRAAKMLGLDPATATDATCLCEIASRVNRQAALQAKDYRYVEGPVTKALKYGYFLEMQEVGSIRRPGVCIALNALLESGKGIQIELPTGEVVKKDPHCIIVFTSNDAYEGTCNLNQSVLSRMCEVHYFSNPKVQTMAARALEAIPDYPDKAQALKCAESIREISDYLKAQSISDGVCGQRELTNWLQAAWAIARRTGEAKPSMKTLRKACQTTVLNKVSQDRELIASVANACINPKYGDCSLVVEC